MTWKAIYKIAVVTSYAQMVVNSIAADLGGLSHTGAGTLPSLKPSTNPDQGKNHNQKGVIGCLIT